MSSPSDEIQLLTELVTRRSVTPDDAGCQAVLAERLRAAGFTTEDMPFGDVSNLWARRGTTTPLLCFAGHTDVVPPGDAQAWTSDPFSLDLRSGHIYGRGTADMKSGIAAMVCAVERFVAAHPDHNGSIALLVTSDEEGPARDGTRKVVDALTARNEGIDWCVIGEPSCTERLGDTMRVGRRGSMSADITVNGIQGHSAYPHLGDNPITRFAPAMLELVQRQWDAGDGAFPPTSFQFVEVVSSGGATNVTPGTLTARCNFRFSTAWNYAKLQAELTSILDRHEVDYSVNWRYSGEPFYTGSGPLTAAGLTAIQEVTGIAAECSTGGGTSDGRFIAPAGADVIEFGPVNASIHAVDEHIAAGDIERLSRIYERIIELLLLR